MKKKNIIHIFWNNSYLADFEKRRFAEIFREKYGNENIEICSLDDISWKDVEAKISTLGLFQQKRLFLFFGGKKKRKWARKTKQKKQSETTLWLEKIADTISDEDFLIFSHVSSGEFDLLDWLTKYATPREQKLSWNARDWQKYTSLSAEYIKKVLAIYQNAERFREKGNENPFLGHAIAHSLNCLALLEKTQPITESDIQSLCSPFEWAKIFDLIDNILAKNIPQALKILKQITEHADQKALMMFFGGFQSLIRQSLYIITLRDNQKSQAEIPKILKSIHPYVVGKNFKSPLKAKEIGDFYKKITGSSIAYKQWKWLEKMELWRILDIEIALMGLQK